MAEKPFTITRVPKPRPDAAAGKPAGQKTPTDASACPTCGALVADPALHRAHHDRTDRWVDRVNGVLQTVLQAIRIRAATGEEADHV
ncbi:hypothetical protein A5733_03370 [Mycobacterium sp. NS-7484]|uniref:hypothetical protein n=1 Tax=Mycobacterium sp. NS-7484 TaxID=1834161 RepID=UPI00096E041B|nr:hypothetical protein [Mycobacterium sp. NS-7484]OMC00892.1 hypothetical protein A5733_03370 [Mycobacterium sp. NS-7484]